MRQSFLIIISLATLASCSEKNSTQVQPAVAQQIAQPAPQSAINNFEVYRRYSFSTNGCATGLKEFRSQEEFCNRLLDDSFNGNCARELRAQTHAFECRSVGGTSATGFAKLGHNAAYCSTQGDDLSRGLSLMKNYSNQEFISWSGREQKSVRLIGGMVKKFGLGYLDLNPKRGESIAQATLVFKSEESGTKTQLKSSPYAQMALSKTSLETDKRLSSVCRFDESFIIAAKATSQVTCDYYAGDASSSVRRTSAVTLNFDGKKRVEQSVDLRGVAGTMRISLEPGSPSKMRLVIEGAGLTDLEAEAAIAAGLELDHLDEGTGEQILVRCNAAQK